MKVGRSFTEWENQTWPQSQRCELSQALQGHRPERRLQVSQVTHWKNVWKIIIKAFDNLHPNPYLTFSRKWVDQSISPPTRPHEVFKSCCKRSGPRPAEEINFRDLSIDTETEVRHSSGGAVKSVLISNPHTSTWHPHRLTRGQMEHVSTVFVIFPWDTQSCDIFRSHLRSMNTASTITFSAVKSNRMQHRRVKRSVTLISTHVHLFAALFAPMTSLCHWLPFFSFLFLYFPFLSFSFPFLSFPFTLPSPSFLALLYFPFLSAPSLSTPPLLLPKLLTRKTHQMKPLHCFRCKFEPESELNKRLPLYNVTAFISDSSTHNRRNVSFYWDTMALWQLLSPSSSPAPSPPGKKKKKKKPH